MLNNTKIYEMNKAFDIIFLKMFLCILFMIFRNSTMPIVRKIIRKNIKNKFEINITIIERSNVVEVKSLFLSSKLIQILPKFLLILLNLLSTLFKSRLLKSGHNFSRKNISV